MARQYVGPGGGLINETGARQYVGPDGQLFNETSGGGGTPSATISWTESDDTTIISTTVTILPAASLAWTEANDGSAVTVNVTITTVTGSMSWTEANDTSAVAVTVAVVAGTLSTEHFTNNTGTILANLTGLTVTVLDMSTFAFVKTFTGQTTNASGVLTINDPLFVSAVQYAIVTRNASGVLGVEKATAT